MALRGKIEGDVELKSSGDKFYKIYSAQVHQMPTASAKIKSVDLHEGHWEHPGAIKQWTYVIDGKTEIFKEKVHFDDKDKVITMECVGGHAVQKYKKFKSIFHVENKGQGGVVKLVMEFEKNNVADELPHKYFDFVADFIKDIDNHLVKVA